MNDGFYFAESRKMTTIYLMILISDFISKTFISIFVIIYFQKHDILLSNKNYFVYFVVYVILASFRVSVKQYCKK